MSNWRQTLEVVFTILSSMMLLLALGISVARTIQQMITTYVIQAVLLGVITLLTISETNNLVWALFLLIPIFLASFIEIMLVQASVTSSEKRSDRVWDLLKRSTYYSTIRKAHSTWPTQPQGGLRIAIILGLVVVAFATSFNLVKGKTELTSEILAISLSLLLLGLFMMSSKKDIISQVIGLLMMEQGMALAAVRGIKSPQIAPYFAIGLFLYIIITLTILVFLLPDLHAESGSIEVERQRQLKG